MMKKTKLLVKYGMKYTADIRFYSEMSIESNYSDVLYDEQLKY